MKMKKALSLMLAASMVLGSFSFASAAPATADQFGRIVESGIFVGDNGDLMLDKTFNRAEFATVALRLMGEGFTDAETEALKIAADFKDVEAGKWFSAYVGRAQKEGLVQGDLATKLYSPENTVSYVEALTIVMRALGYEDGTDLTNYPSGYYTKAVELGLADSTVKADSKIVRKVIAEMLETALDLTVKGGTHTLAQHIGIEEVKAEELAVEAVEAVGARKIAVEFNKEVDTTKAVLAVKREAVKVNTTSITWNADKTVATIELGSKISKANYTVEVTGLDAVLTGTFEGAEEKVSAIEILSTDASLTELDADGIDDITVSYKVFNQYNEDVTKVTPLIATSSGTNTNVVQNKGIIEITGNFDAYVSNKAAVTIIHASTGVSATATLNVVAEAKVGEIKVVGLYNKDGKSLTEATNLSTDRFYLEIEAVDQYGLEIDPAAKEAQILFSESNNTRIKLDETAPGVPNVVDTVVDGKYHVQLTGVNGNFAKDGSSTITLISRSTGKSNSYVVTIGEGSRAQSVSISQPELVAMGEDAFLPLSVYNKDGNEIKDLTLLNDSVRGITVNGGTLVLKDGALFVKVLAAQNNAETIKTVVVTVNATYQVTSVNYTVRATAVPKVIVGLKSTVSSQLNGGIAQEIGATNLIIEDQYGRQLSNSKINNWLDTANNSITVNSTLGANTAVTVHTTGEATTDDAAVKAIASSATKFIVTPNTVSGSASSEKLTFTLVENLVALSSSSKDLVFAKSELAEYASYEIDAPASIYNVNGSNFELEVYGVKADGKKVKLDPSKYSLNYTTSVFDSISTVNGTHTITMGTALATTVIDNDSNTTIPDSKEYTFTVTIGNSDATQVSHKVAVSAKAQNIAEIGFTTTGVNTASNFDGSNFVVDGTVLDVTDLAKYAFAKDVYGVYTDNFNGFANVTFSNLQKTTGSSAAIVVATNGTATASVNNLQVGDRVTVTVTKNGASKTLEITVVEVN